MTTKKNNPSESLFSSLFVDEADETQESLDEDLRLLGVSPEKAVPKLAAFLASKIAEARRQEIVRARTQIAKTPPRASRVPPNMPHHLIQENIMKITKGSVHFRDLKPESMSYEELRDLYDDLLATQGNADPEEK